MLQYRLQIYLELDYYLNLLKYPEFEIFLNNIDLKI